MERLPPPAPRFSAQVFPPATSSHHLGTAGPRFCEKSKHGPNQPWNRSIAMPGWKRRKLLQITSASHPRRSGTMAGQADFTASKSPLEPSATAPRSLRKMRVREKPMTSPRSEDVAKSEAYTIASFFSQTWSSGWYLVRNSTISGHVALLGDGPVQGPPQSHSPQWYHIY